MTTTEQRQQIVRGCVILLAVIACAFLWLSVLTFKLHDYPNPHVYPWPEPANNAAGQLGALVSYHLHYYLGKGAYAALGGFSMALFVLVRQGRLPSLWQRVIGIALLIAVTSATAHLLTEGWAASGVVARGGVLGYALATWLGETVGWIQYPILLYCLIVGLVFTAEGMMMKLPEEFRRRGEQLREMAGDYLPPKPQLATVAGPLRRALGRLPLWPAGDGTSATTKTAAHPRDSKESIKINAGNKRYAAARQAEGTLWNEEEPPTAVIDDESSEEDDQDQDIEEADEDLEAEDSYEDAEDDDEDDLVESEDDDDTREAPLTPEPHVKIVAPVKLPAHAPDVAKKPYPMELEEWEFPSVSILEEPEFTFSERQEEIVREKAKVLERALQEYRIEAVVVEIDTGPVITMFEIKVAPGVKVSQISSLANDIARALRAPSIRVVAPIPGKSTIGIEVPNVDKEKVRMKELMTLGAEASQKMTLPLFLGKVAAASRQP